MSLGVVASVVLVALVVKYKTQVEAALITAIRSLLQSH